MSEPNNESWHLDKRVPVAIVLTIVIQTVGLLVTGTAMAVRFDARLSAVESYQAENKTAPADIAVIKSEITNIKEMLRQLMSQPRQRP